MSAALYNSGIGIVSRSINQYNKNQITSKYIGVYYVRHDKNTKV